MADVKVDTKAEKKKLKDERQKLKNEQKAQRKEAKKRAREISAQEAELDEDEEPGGVSVFLVTLIIVVIWIGILCLLIKLDVGGFGSNVLAPVLRDVPVISKILPSDSTVASTDPELYGGYDSLSDSVLYIKELELELEQAQAQNAVSQEEITSLRAEVERLQTFESAQVEFERIKTEFYEEVVYSDKGPGAEEYRKYYEEMDPTTAEYLYKQVILQDEIDSELEEYAKAYAAMKPKAAAGIFEQMTDDLELASKILGLMSADDRGDILGVMDPGIAAKITEIMEPDVY